MAAWGRFKEFVNRNILLVVMIPSIGGLHWVWQKIQEDEVFVAKHERREFPPITVMAIRIEKLYDRFVRNENE